PIGVFAAWAYYKQGYVNFPVAGLLCLGFILGCYLGAKFVVGLSEVALRRVFAVCLLFIAGYMLVK
ncbi:MAG: sulfite exporter TauE/SafE family protein, partial [Candidatus Omnitrophica bacterium]|nr:sulfite exporter TauE/SafE family protein [Candidatus Omnitrophota bacterium]